MKVSWFVNHGGCRCVRCLMVELEENIEDAIDIRVSMEGSWLVQSQQLYHPATEDSINPQPQPKEGCQQ